MSLFRFFVLFVAILFGGIFCLSVWKKGSSAKDSVTEISLSLEIPAQEEPVVVKEAKPTKKKKTAPPLVKTDREPPEADRIGEFFNLYPPKFPIIETVTYRSRVPWLQGRPAWLADYAGHYKTSRHFIARSLNQKSEYEKQNISEGQKFNVLRDNKNIEFRLVIDLSRSKMWFYYHDLDADEIELVKTYPVGLGRPDPSTPSGLLTPLGKYSLGEKIAVYKPKIKGLYQGNKTEMIQVFGTRWIPFDKELSGCTASSKGYGIHGLPWVSNGEGELVEDRESLGQYASDGCIRLATEDIEELYSIIITRPTTVELVRDYFDSELAQAAQ